MSNFNYNDGDELDGLVYSIVEKGRNYFLFYGALITVMDTGLMGVAAITAALVMLGPMVLVGGIATITIGKDIIFGINKFGAQRIALRIVDLRLEMGEDAKTIIDYFESPFIPLRIKDMVKKYLSEKQ